MTNFWVRACPRASQARPSDSTFSVRFYSANSVKYCRKRKNAVLLSRTFFTSKYTVFVAMKAQKYFPLALGTQAMPLQDRQHIFIFHSVNHL